MHVCEADGDAEAMRSYRAALEVALDAPSAAHPIEAYGPGEQSIAGARREVIRVFLYLFKNLRLVFKIASR